MDEISQNGGNLIKARVSGKLTTTDSRALQTAWERVMDERGAERKRFIADDLAVWQPGAAWHELQREVSPPKAFESVATVREHARERRFTRISSRFGPERPAFLSLDGDSEAEHWVRAG